ncbi:MAG: hypothetical protein RLT05_28550, partial [Bauldia litoralis]
IVAVTAPVPVVAADAWGPPTVDFTADMEFRNGEGQVRKARLYYTAAKQRLEFLAGEEPVALLVDTVAKKNLLLLLNRREYRATAYAQPDYFFGVSQPESKRRKVGDETLLGRKVDRMEVNAKARTGDLFDGTAWVTAERIVVRLEGTIARGKQKQKISMTMTALTVGPVDAALLAVPEGYKALPPPKKR